ncbi:hypothetical protein SESBI_08653 [Sesbania bispinosa]|nr:hypothetical protein SESBI_08653 [Sesbania bispinosa]
MGFSIAFYRVGKFVFKHFIIRGEIHVFHGLDIDTRSYFEALELAKDLGYGDKVNAVQVNEGNDNFTEPKNLNEAPNVEEERVESDYNEDSMRDVHFDENEEERATRANDGFRIPEVGQVEANLNKKYEEEEEHHRNNVRVAESAQGPSSLTQEPPPPAQVTTTLNQVPLLQSTQPMQGAPLQEPNIEESDAMNDARGSGSSNAGNKDK